MTEVVTAKVEAEQTAAVARQAQAAMHGAQAVNQGAQAEKLAQRDEQSESLVLETQKFGQTADTARAKEGDSPGETVFSKPQLAEYLLDGCHESGIRYLLRIS